MTPSLPLDTFARSLGYNPWHFWGCADTGPLRVTSACDPVLGQYEYQSRLAPSRSEISQAIELAEGMLFDELRYRIAPKYASVELDWPRLWTPELLRSRPADSDSRWLSVQLPEYFLHSIGTELLTAVSLGELVTYSDLDGDGYLETFTVGPVATTVTDVTEVIVYFSSGDRGGDSIDDRWRIQPLKITISGGMLTIVGKAWLVVRPILYEGFTAQPIDPAIISNFVTDVDIYRRTTKTDGITVDDSQAVLIWETRPRHGWWCACSGCTVSTFAGSVYDPAATAKAVARVGIRDKRRGLVTPAEAAYDASTGLWSSLSWGTCDEADRVIIRYRAGVPLDADGQVSSAWRDTIVRLACAELQRPISGCSDANSALFHWQQDLAKTGNEREVFNPSTKVTDNPFGTRRGHVYAWDRVTGSQQFGSILIG